MSANTMRGVIIIGFALTFITIFVLSSWMFDHLSPSFVVNAVTPEGMDDVVFKGHFDFHCPTVSFDFVYDLPGSSSLAKIQMVVEGRTVPIDLCRPTALSPGSAPLCPGVGCSGTSCFRGRMRVHGVHVPICDKLHDSHPLIRIIPSSNIGPLAVGSLVRHETS